MNTLPRVEATRSLPDMIQVNAMVKGLEVWVADLKMAHLSKGAP